MKSENPEVIASLRAELREFLGYEEIDVRVPVGILAQEEKDGYTQSRVVIENPDGDRISAYLLEPSGSGPCPAVIVHHQHHGQWHLGKSEVCGLAGDSQQAFGPVLARGGLVVLAPDSICFEDRRPHALGTEPDAERDWLGHYNAMAARLLRGETLMQKVLSDAQTALCALRSFHRVDPQKISTMGHSYGGNTVLFHAALDERIQFACASGTGASYRERIERGTGIEMSEVVPGFLTRFEIIDLLRCIAPRPLLLVSGFDDPYAADADQVARRARSSYELFGAGNALEYHQLPGGHAITQKRFDQMIRWIENQASR